MFDKDTDLSFFLPISAHSIRLKRWNPLRANKPTLLLFS